MIVAAILILSVVLIAVKGMLHAAGMYVRTRMWIYNKLHGHHTAGR